MIIGVSPDLPHTAELPPAKEWVLRLFRAPVRLLLRSWWRVQVRGAEQVPASGPVILAHHIGVLDGPALVAVTPRLTFAIAKVELFSGMVGRVLTNVGQIPVNRRLPAAHALSRAIQVLRAGKVLAVFPEGRRTSGGVTYARHGAGRTSPWCPGHWSCPWPSSVPPEPGQGRGAVPHPARRSTSSTGSPSPCRVGPGRVPGQRSRRPRRSCVCGWPSTW